MRSYRNKRDNLYMTAIMRVIVISFLFTLFCYSSYARNGLLLGAGNNDHHIMGKIAVANTVDTTWSWLIDVSFNSTQTDITPTPVYTITMAQRLRLSFLLSPEVNIIDTQPDYIQSATYISMATGAYVGYQINTRYSLFAGIHYRARDLSTPRTRFALAFCVWL
jgi:hypothetical protein